MSGDAAAGRLLASDHNLEFVDLDRYSIDASASRLLPEAVARHHHVVPIGRKFGAPVVAITDPTDVVALDTLRATLGRDFVTVVAPDDQIESCLARVYRVEPAPTSGSAPMGETSASSTSASNGASPPSTTHPQVTDIPDNSPPDSSSALVDSSPPSAAAVWETPLDTVFDTTPVPPFSGTGEVPPSTTDIDAGGSANPTVPPERFVGPSEDEESGADDELTHFPPLARVLVEGKRVDLSTMRDVLAERDRTGQAVARILTVRGLVNESDLMWGMAQEMGLEFVDLDLQSTDFAAAYHLPEATARHHNVLVFGNRDGVPLVAASNPTDVFAMDDLRTIIGRNFITVVATRSQINTYIDRAYHQGGDASEVAQSVASDFDEGFDDDLGNLQAVVDDAPIVRYVNLLVLQALNERASDIHVEPTGENLRIRYRIDGVLHDISTAPRTIAAAVTTRLKVMSDMNIAEHRLPQDGRISLTVGSRSIDLRIATLPTIYGEKVVMRVLDKSNIVLGFEDLGFDDDLLALYRGVYTKPYGTILVTGPTGSGKTTTLYATLAALNAPEKNIITVEDPVELRLKGINQVQLNIKAGLNFAAALKSILRSDPDIVLVGEIRDRETAMMTIEASLTGHLVLSTLHTNDSASTPMRLVEMGMEPFLVTSALSAALAQRLARRLCVHCREAYEPTEAEIVAAGWTLEELFANEPNPILYRAVGCSACSTTGYLGRKALLELLIVTESIEHLIIEGGTADDIHRLAVEQGMVTLRQSGLRKALEGETTLEEVLRVVA
jgi:type IV pilus assembly protein PilB